ncbi:MAG TPA: sugar phosphate isomerase/epimerase [Candidatus Paceibacterota bacterium]|nr:sugar phosphate isomerase/epimerase [Verrucomicrobiota bacterium]HRZ46922.1 sugar phosphate isomerase/epimerase [Candidatus Paceibacterota bacterium]HRZ93718.1 sugar phosphate isomerase/epimerase [Candidatus Paceibacterota bacterium]
MRDRDQIDVVDRRQFLRRAGVAMAGGGVLLASRPFARSAGREAVPSSPGQVGSNIYGWSQYYQRDGKDVQAHLDEVMSALRDAGYDYLECFMDTANPENNARLGERMKAKGLKPVSLYTGARLHEEAAAEAARSRIVAAARVCRSAGFEIVSCNADPIGRAKTESELAIQAAALDRLGKELAELGLRMGLHHHLPEMADQGREFHRMFRDTDPERVGFCYDVHWVFRGGIRPIEALAAYGNRVVTWHLRQSREGIWWEDLDSGDIDYREVAQYALEHRLPRRFTVELALEKNTRVTRSAVENHRRSIEYVRRVFGV